MKTWLENWKRRKGLDIEAELRAARPKAPDRLVRSIVGRLNPRPSGSRARYGFAAALAVASLAVLGAMGGFSYAANNIAGAFNSMANVVHFSGPLPSQHRTSASNQYNVPPHITKVSPTTAFGNKSKITVSGTNIQANTLTVAGISVGTLISNTPTAVSFLAPTHAGSVTGPVVITTAYGSDSSQSVTLIEPPAINSGTDTPHGLSDTSLEANQVITVNGTGFTGTTGVNFIETSAGKPKATKATFTVVSDTQLSVTVPSSLAVTGVSVIGTGVQVVNGAGNATSSQTFTYTAAAPTVTSFTPLTGVAQGQPNSAQTVTITGTNFDSGDTVYFGGVAADPVTDNQVVTGSTQISVEAPSNAATGQITVTDAAGGSGVSKLSFTPIIKPTVTVVHPLAAPATGGGSKIGGTLTIKGSHFAGVTGINFPSVLNAAKPTLNKDGSLSVKVPTGATTGNITVGNAAGSVTAAFQVIVLPVAKGDTMTVTDTNVGTHGQTGPIPGDNLKITTTTAGGFNGVTQVTIGKTVIPSAQFTTFTASEIDLTLLNPTTSGNVTVTNAAGSAKSTTVLTMTAAPSIKTMPSTGIAAGQTNGPDTLTITGTGFLGAGTTTTHVLFSAVGGGTTSATPISNNGTTITVQAPADTAAGVIKITSDAGTTTSKSSFAPIKIPDVTAGTPAVDHAGDLFGGAPNKTSIVLSGSWLNSNTAVGTKVTFPGVVTPVTVKVTIAKTGGQSVSVKIPLGATNGSLTITNAAGAQTFDGFEAIVHAPTPTGPLTMTHGTTVNITGSNFLGVTAVKVGATNIPAANITVTDATHLSITLPSTAKLGTNLVLSMTDAFGTGNLIGVTVN